MRTAAMSFAFALALAVLLCMNQAAATEWTCSVDELYVDWDNPNSPGVMLMVLKDHEIAYQQHFGMANIEKGIKIDSDSLFNLASISKQFTAAAVAHLVIAEKLTLDDNIRVYLPYLPAYEETITVNHLVHHMSGIPDVYGVMEKRRIEFKRIWGNEDILPIVAQITELEFKPGEKFRYSNTNYVLLSEIVHKASGITLRQYLERKFFVPLGMASTRLDDDLSDMTVDRVESYWRKGSENSVHLPRLDYVTGDGNIITSMTDFTKWDANLYTGAVGGTAWRDLMLTRGVLNSGETISYAFGLMIAEQNGRKTIRHSGGWLGFRCEWIQFPDDKVSVMVFGNHNAAPQAQKVADLYFAGTQ